MKYIIVASSKKIQLKTNKSILICVLSKELNFFIITKLFSIVISMKGKFKYYIELIMTSMACCVYQINGIE